MNSRGVGAKGVPGDGPADPSPSPSSYALIAEPAADGSRRWRLFTSPRRSFAARSVEEVSGVLEEASRRADAEWVVGYVAYEAAPAFDSALVCHDSQEPLAWFASFDEVRGLSEAEAQAWLEPAPGAEAVAAAPEWRPEWRAEWRAECSADRHRGAMEAIRAGIAAGDVYQVNYTFPLVEATPTPPGEIRALFRRLDAAQRAPYAALIEAPPVQICSVSPELFFRRRGDRLESRPMKGTAPRGRYPAEDRALAEGLARSEKDRAENLMIVDMIRNDLGRVARPGSVRVDALFEIESYPTVHQMVSTVSAHSSASMPEIFAALFPCASITGAPKVTAMRAIRELEASARGVYTGAVGVLGPHRQACFNVAIRTAWRTRVGAPLRYGTGSGVVWESSAEDEYRECLVKTRVLSADSAVPDLFETMLWRPRLGFWLLREHLERMASSAAHFGIAWDEDGARDVLGRAMSGVSVRSRVRLLLDRHGQLRVEVGALGSRRRESWRVALDPEPIAVDTPLLFHKTTRREIYERSLERTRASVGECDDALLWNERGELTESTRANLLVCLDGRWLTPPVEAGLLAGTLRRRLLERGRVQEARLTTADLDRASDLLLVNSVRGFVRARRLSAAATKR